MSSNSPVTQRQKYREELKHQQAILKSIDNALSEVDETSNSTEYINTLKKIKPGIEEQIISLNKNISDINDKAVKAKNIAKRNISTRIRTKSLGGKNKNKTSKRKSKRKSD